LTDKKNYDNLSFGFFMKVRLKVIANAKQDSICGFKGGYLKVKVSKPAIEGAANEAVIKLISSFFDIRKSNIKILSGEKSHIKTLELNIEEQVFNSKIERVSHNANL